MWTQEVIRLLFKNLKEKFGPKSCWENDSYPSLKKKNEFDQFCNDFRKIVFSLTGEFPHSIEAIKLQIRWGSQKINSNVNEKSMVKRYIMNRAASLETGFIEVDSLPNSIKFENEVDYVTNS